MANLYGEGCERCNKEIAAALKAMPAMDGYLDTNGYAALYITLPEGTWPKPHCDGAFIPHTTECVPGDDGWVLAMVMDDPRKSLLCPCGSENVLRRVYRGKVELR